MSNPERQIAVQTLDIRNVGRDFNDRSQLISINLKVVNCDDSTNSRSTSVMLNDGPVQVSRESKAGGVKSWKRRFLKGKARASAKSSKRSATSGKSKGGGGEASGDVDTTTEGALNISAMDHLPSPSQAPSRPTFHEIYVDRLLDAGHGLPCWEPRPFSNDVEARGAVPGDVGTYTTQRGFHKAFNLWEDKEAFQAYARACGAIGATCRIGTSSSMSSSTAPLLEPISSADLVATDDNEAMQAYIIQHAEAIYKYAKSIRGIGVGEPLCIVTGCIKSDMWAIAAYQQLRTQGSNPPRILRLATSQAKSEKINSSAYRWTLTPESSYARIGDSGVQGLKNQILFLQGFKLAFSPQFVSRMNESSTGSGPDPSGPGEGSGGPDDWSRQSGGGGFHSSGGNASQDQGGGNASNRAGGSRFGRWGFMRQRFGRRQQSLHKSSPSASLTESPYREREMQFSRFPYGKGTIYHPCDAINQDLLRITKADAALSHDDDWCQLFRSAAATRSPEITLTKGSITNADRTVAGVKLRGDGPRPVVQQTRSVSVKNGVAFLVPLDVKKPSPVAPNSTSEAHTSLHSQDRRGKATSTSRSASSDEKQEREASPSGSMWPKSQSQRKRGLDKLPKKQSSWGYSTSKSSYGASSRVKGFTPPWKRAVKLEDPIFEDGDRNDMVIIVMGPTGAGKSTFINEYLGKEVTPVSDGMESCTQQISYHPHVLPESHPICPGRRLVLIDTPGFDNTYNTAYETLRRISICLASTYENELRVANILYLNSVSQKRMFGSMATTHWDCAELESAGLGTLRETEFRQNFWKDILDAGASLERIQDYKSDPERIINEILQKTQKREMETMHIQMQIQHELVEQQKRLPDTKAGKKLRYTLEEYELMFKAAALKIPVADRIKSAFRFKREWQ